MASKGSSNNFSAASAFMRDLPSSSNLCSQLKPAAERPKAPLPTVYYAKHQYTEPPPSQVVETEKTNILLRQFHQLAEAKRERQKRLPTDSQLPSCRPAKTPKAGPCAASSSTFQDDKRQQLLYKERESADQHLSARKPVGGRWLLRRSHVFITTPSKTQCQ